MKYFIINNNKINYIPENRSIIEYCENLNINIPHYCYHPNLSIAGNCRMCLVEVKNSPKPVISCAMSLLNKMEIYTDSPLVKKSREGVLEFLLLNHPLDCPVCDQGGECDLQDQSFVFGINKKRFYNYKRIVTNKNIGPIVKTVMTRCIHCTRCVRFSKEIAGIESLGMFGRGINSEIGTYVNKTFNSELSGNIIDICPVGALTSKQYPFLGRNWELKNIKSIDYSDSSATPIQVFVKSNSVVKVTPGYNTNSYSNTWISDKTRFSFDGMFSPERVFKPFLSVSNDQENLDLKWSQLFDEIILITYFHDHLARHTYQNLNIYIIFNNNIDLESLNLLLLLSAKHPFIKLRRIENQNTNVDLESTFMENSLNKGVQFSESNICFLVNINPRYENPSLNLLIRKRLSTGNFKVLYSGASLDLRYNSVNTGSSFNFIQKLTTGNSIFCQDFINSNNPTVLLSSNILKRKDSESLIYKLQNLSNTMKCLKKTWNGYNFISTELNETGIHFVNKFNKFNSNNFSDAFGLYFIDLKLNSIEFNQLINMKLLNLIFIENQSKLLLELQNTPKTSILNDAHKNFNCSSIIKLPNKTFFETSNVFMNNHGQFKKTIKVVSPLNKSKENWQIIRKISSSLLNINFLSSYVKKDRVTFDVKNFLNFLKFSSFNFFPVSSINNNSIFYKENSNRNLTLLNNRVKKKNYNTKHIYWIEDFYIGGRDNYSSFSSIMIECSYSFRKEDTNFKYII